MSSKRSIQVKSIRGRQSGPRRRGRNSGEFWDRPSKIGGPFSTHRHSARDSQRVIPRETTKPSNYFTRGSHSRIWLSPEKAGSARVFRGSGVCLLGCLSHRTFSSTSPERPYENEFADHLSCRSRIPRDDPQRRMRSPIKCASRAALISFSGWKSPQTSSRPKRLPANTKCRRSLPPWRQLLGLAA